MSLTCMVFILQFRMRKVEKIMMGEANNQKHSALKAAHENNGRNKKAKDESWCDFCNRSNHTREMCWKLHGKPAHMEGKPQFNSKGKNQAKTSKGFHVESANQQASESVLPLQLLKICCFPRNNWNYFTS